MQDMRKIQSIRTRLKASPLARYGLAIVVTLFALGLTMLLRPLISNTRYALFFAAVTVSIAYGGRWAGLLSTVVSIILIDIFVFLPHNQLSVTPDDIINLLIFSGVSLVINSLYYAGERARREAYAQEETVRVTLLSIGDAVITTDTAGKITFLNPAAEALTGWSLADAIDKPLMTVLNIINEQTRQAPENPVVRVMTHKLTIGLANHTLLIARGGIEYTIEDSAAPIRDTAGGITGVVIVFRDATARREAEAVQELLLDVTDKLIQVVNNQIDLANYAHLFTRRFADWCELMILDDNQQPQFVHIHRDPAQQAALDALYSHLPDAWNTSAQAMQRGEPIITLAVTDTWKTAPSISADDLTRMEALNPGSQIYLPLQFNGRMLGVLGLTRTGGLRHHFNKEDIAAAEDIGRRLSLALDSAWLARQAVNARQIADQNAVRIARLQQVTQTLNAVLTPREVGQTVIDQVIATFPGVFGGFLALIVENENLMRPVYFTGYQPQILPFLQNDIPLDDDSPVSIVMRRGTPEFLSSEAEYKAAFPKVERWVDTRSLAMLPLHANDQMIGYIAISFNLLQAFPPADRALLGNLADQAAQALYRSQLYVAEQDARRIADRNADRIARLQQITEALNTAIEPDQVGRIVIEQVQVAFQGIFGAIIGQVSESEGLIRLVYYAGYQTFNRNEIGRDLRLDESMPASNVIRNNVPEFYATEREWLTTYPDGGSWQKTLSLAMLPLRVGEKTIGYIGISFDVPQAFTPDDRALLLNLANLIAQALSRAQLYVTEQNARQDADRNAAQIARLQQVTQALNTARQPDDVARIIGAGITKAFPAVSGSLIGLLDEPTGTIRVSNAADYRLNVQGAMHNVLLSDQSRPEADAIQHNTALYFRNFEEWHTRYPEAATWTESRAVAILPLRVDDKRLGHLTVGFTEPQSFPESDQTLLTNLADQTAQTLYRTQLFSAEQDARRAIDTIMNGMNDVFYSLDREMRYVYVNRRAEANLSLPREQLIGQRVTDVLPMSDALRIFLERATDTLERNTPAQYEDYVSRTNEWFDIHLYPQADGLTAYMTDITARRLAEQQARFSSEQLQLIAESNLLGILTTGPTGNIIQANDRFLTTIGYTRADLEAGRINWQTLTPPNWDEADQRAITQIMQQGFTDRYEKEYYHQDGHKVPILIGGVRAGDLWLILVIDLTEQKRAENGLRLLTEASAILTSLDDPLNALRRIAEMAVPLVADWFVVYLLEADQTLQPVLPIHSDPAKTEWASNPARRSRHSLNGTTFISRVATNGQAMFFPEVTDNVLVHMGGGNADLLADLRAVQYTSLIIVPLRIQGNVIGVLHIAATESRLHYTSGDLELMQELARRVSIALDNARLYGEVQHERERLQVTLTSIGDAVIATDAQGIITFMNPVAIALTGWVEQDAVGRPLAEIFILINEYSRTPVESPVTKVLREGTIVGLANHTLLIARDGNEIPIDDSGAPIRDGDGNLIGVVLVFRDIRERRETERQIDEAFLRTSDLYFVSRQIGVSQTPESLLASLLTSRYLRQARQVAIVLFDTIWDGNTPAVYRIAASLNDLRLIGFAPDHKAGETPVMSIFDPNQPIFIEDSDSDTLSGSALKETLRNAGVSNVIMFPLRTTGGCFGALLLYNAVPNKWNDLDFQTLRVSADQVAIVIESLRLLEAERAAHQEAERANQLKLQFLAMISHELRTPLTSIKGFTSTLLADDVTWDAETQHEFLGIMDSEADKLGDLINQLLDLSQLQAGTMRINPTLQPISTMFDIADVQLVVLTRNHHLDIAVPPDLPPVLIDVPRIAEVLTNLVGNATKYTPPGTTIRITADRITDPQHGDMVRVGVSDQGPGIPLESREQIFEAFRQLDRKGDRPVKGAGLGLAICKGIVEAHGGRIWVTDGVPNGAVFYFTLLTVPLLS